MEKQMDKINSFKGKYAFLSNFFYAPISYRNFIVDSVEVAYQAEKCDNYEDLVMIAHMNSRDAKICSRIIKIREDWDSVKVPIMKELCRRKFTKYASLRQMLLATGDIPIEEGNSWGDTFWGVVNGKGQNNLGKILMELREELK